MRKLPLALLASGAVVSAALADPAPILSRAAVEGVARDAASQALGKPVQLRVRRLAVQGRWAFVFAGLEAPGGGPVDYTGTPKADAAAHGMASHDFAALLSKSDEGWSVVAEAVGPTDMPWETWPQTYGAPAGLFVADRR